jgi:hypothetical protein
LRLRQLDRQAELAVVPRQEPEDLAFIGGASGCGGSSSVGGAQVHRHRLAAAGEQGASVQGQELEVQGPEALARLEVRHR